VDADKIVLVTRKTRLEELVERFNTRGQAKFYLNQNNGDGAFGYYEREHAVYYAARSSLHEHLLTVAARGHTLKVQTIERDLLSTFTFGAHDIVVIIGADGLVVNTAKYLSGQPIIAVNPDPSAIDGLLLPFDIGTALAGLQAVMTGRYHAKTIRMAEVRLNTGERQVAFNDIFVGVRGHVSARYQLTFAGQTERHSSSGIIVSTGVGRAG